MSFAPLRLLALAAATAVSLAVGAFTVGQDDGTAPADDRQAAADEQADDDCGCENNGTDAAGPTAAPGNTIVLYSSECITEAEVIDAQKEWGEGIVRIGKVYAEGGDYEQAAEDHIQDLYGYDLSSVLFKPTMASIDQFRGTFDGALSYFVGGNATYPEDGGFAIAPYTRVRWENSGIINNSCNMAIAMGNYYFMKEDGEEVKVEFTLGYVKDARNKLRIVVHKSALPYSPE